MNITEPDCICSRRYPACNAHVRYCHVWPSTLYRDFPHYLINGTISEIKLRNTKCMFWFSLQILSETYLIVRRNERDMIKMYIGLYVKYTFFLSDFKWNLNFLERCSKNPQISNFMKIRPMGAELFHVDGRADTTKLIVAFRNFAKAPKKGSPWCLQKPCWWNVIDHCICVNMQYCIIYVTMPCVKCHHLCFCIFGLVICLQGRRLSPANSFLFRVDEFLERIPAAHQLLLGQ